jgi:GTP-binding protein
MHKNQFLAISKSDLLDEELMNEVRKELPKNIKTLFISSVSQLGIQSLKDELWKLLQD